MKSWQKENSRKQRANNMNEKRNLGSAASRSPDLNVSAYILSSSPHSPSSPHPSLASLHVLRGDLDLKTSNQQNLKARFKDIFHISIKGLFPLCLFILENELEPRDCTDSPSAHVSSTKPQEMNDPIFSTWGRMQLGLGGGRGGGRIPRDSYVKSV